MIKKSRLERLVELSMPEPMSGCWLWMGTCHYKGYGQFKLGKSEKKAHRASWILHYGDIPDGMQVLHKCDVRCCVNPDHLYLGTNLDNVRDRVRRKRSVITPEWREKQKRARAALWATPEYRAKVVAAQKRVDRKAIAKEFWQRPEYRERQAAARAKRFANYSGVAYADEWLKEAQRLGITINNKAAA